MMGSDVAQELPGPAAEMMRNTADFDGALIDYKAKGHTVEFVGKEKLDATEVYHLKVTMKGGSHVQHYYLDAKSGIELKTSADIDMGTGTKQALETEMSNFQQVNGIMIPHTEIGRASCRERREDMMNEGLTRRMKGTDSTAT